MSDIRQDLLAYLVVLNDEGTLVRLTQDERNDGRANMVGCLHRLVDALERSDIIGAGLVLKLVKHREEINGRWQKQMPEQLAWATRCAALQVLIFYLRLQACPSNAL